MTYCTKCGAQLTEGAKYCVNCGAACKTSGESFEKRIRDIDPGSDYTASFAAQDIGSNKGMAVLSYLGLLVLVPLLGARQSPYAQFHVRQGLLLFCLEVVINIVLGALRSVRWLFGARLLGLAIALVAFLVGLCVLILTIIGIVNAARGRARELPAIGKFATKRMRF